MKNFTHDLRIWFKYTVSRFWWKCNFRLDERAADRLEQEIRLRSRTHNQLPTINLTARQIECSLPLRIPERACVILVQVWFTIHYVRIHRLLCLILVFYVVFHLQKYPIRLPGVRLPSEVDDRVAGSDRGRTGCFRGLFHSIQVKRSTSGFVGSRRYELWSVQNSS